MADLTHMGSRVAVTTAESEAARLAGGAIINLAAIRLGQHIEGGDAGEVLRYVHELEYAQQWHVDPWRLIERLAFRFMPGPEPEAPAPAASVEPPETADSAGAVSTAAA